MARPNIGTRLRWKAERETERLQDINADLLAALEACKKELGIRDDFCPLGPALVLAPIIRAAIKRARE